MDVRWVGIWQRCGEIGGMAFILASVLVLSALGGVRLSAEEVKPKDSGALPVLVFQTDGKAVQDRTRVPASLTVLLPEKGGSRFSIDESASGPAELSVRGNSSYNYPKKSYRLELQDGKGSDRKAPLLNLPEDSDWVLYGSVTDKTFTRSVLAHELWRATGRYAIRWRHAEVFVITNQSATDQLASADLALAVPNLLEAVSRTNWLGAIARLSNSNQRVTTELSEGYMGLYVLMEKIKRGKERVNIARLRPEHSKEPEVSGGYIIKKDDDGRGERGLLTGQEFRLRFEEPKETEITDDHKKWIGGYLDQFEKILFGADFRNPSTGYRQFLDEGSFIDFHWMVEFSGNIDGFYFSQYMHKDRGGRIIMGPLWDWDATFGNPFFIGKFMVEGWTSESARDPAYTWFRRLFEDPDFLQNYIDRWQQLRATTYATSNVLAQALQISSLVKAAALRDAEVWTFRNPPRRISAHSTIGFEDQVTRLTNWLNDRLLWIDQQEYPKPVLHAVSDTNGVAVAMAFLDGRLFFTTNGVDPRTPGGGVAPIALEYSKPVEVKAPVKIKARTRSKFGLWSAPVVLNVAPSGTNAVVDRQEGR